MDSISVSIKGLGFEKSVYKDTYGIDGMFALYLWYTMEQSTTVSSIVDFVAVWVSIASWVVETRSRQKDNDIVLTDDKLNHLFATQMLGKLEAMTKHILGLGWVVIQYRLKDGIKNREAKGGDVNIEVLHPLEYQLRYKKTKRGNKKWMAYSRNMYNNEDKPLPHSRVFMFSEPEPYTGRATSALAHAIRGIFQYDEQLALQTIVAHKLAFPVHMYQMNMDKIHVSINDIVAQTETNPAGAEEDIGVADVDTQFLREASLQNAMATIARSIYDKAQMIDNIPGQMDTILDVDGLQEYVKRAIRNPTLPAKSLPPGQTIETGPEAKTNPNFDHLESQLKSQICSVLNVPVEFIFPSGSKFSSDIALSKKIMDMRTTRIHTWLSSILKRIFIDIHMPHIDNKISKIAAHLTVDHMKTFSAKHDRSAFMSTGFVLKEALVNAIEEQLEINVYFAETTSASADALLQAVQTKVISHEKYTQLFLSSFGIPQSAKAKLSKQQHKEMEELLASNQPKEADGTKKRHSDTFQKGESQVAKKQKNSADTELAKLDKKTKIKE